MPGFDAELLRRLGALPGVTSLGIADCPPLAGGCNGTIMTFPDRPPAPQGQNAIIGVHFVSPGWFGTLHIPLKRGRFLDETDRRGGLRAIVINEAAAKKFWPGQDPIGKRAQIFQGGFNADSGGLIVGVVGDVRFGTIDSLPQPDAFLPVAQTDPRRLMFFLRTQGNPLALAPSVRRAIHEFAPQYPLYDIQSMDDRVATATAQSRFSAALLALFASVALALAVMGIYGVMSFAVTQRTREIGIRMALGADGGSVLHLILREGMVLALIGGALGLGAALALTRVMRSLLYEIEPSDPSTYLGIALVLGLAALLASWLPARRAARVDPTVALRRG
jgi:predicted permease